MIKILKMGEVPKEEIFARENPTANVEGAVAKIIDEVKAGGDAALSILEYFLMPFRGFVVGGGKRAP